MVVDSLDKAAKGVPGLKLVERGHSSLSGPAGPAGRVVHLAGRNLGLSLSKGLPGGGGGHGAGSSA